MVSGIKTPEKREEIKQVLTLLILENGLGVTETDNVQFSVKACLNPSYTGKWSRGGRCVPFKSAHCRQSLNPSYTGKWSQGHHRGGQEPQHWKVLTLLILENGLGEK